MLLRRQSHLTLLFLGILAFVLAYLLSGWLGVGAVSAQEVDASGGTAGPDYGMVDPVASQYEVGYQIYLERCATCHVALPPAVLPADTWQPLLTDTAHYGVVLPSLTPFDQQLILNYLLAYSRRHQPGEALPYRLKDSRYFYALHPNVDLPEPLNLRSCVSCHQGAAEQNYRALSNFDQPSE
ncbi:MAG: diheme cytochrome C [Cyanobacteria bacterium J06649_4]